MESADADTERGSQGASTSGQAAGGKQAATVAIVIGMAGSGKTTLVQQMTAYMGAQKRNGYVINLDPAVHNLPYEPNIDIRDTVNYKNVMSEYKLGPNGGILTACNLFATRFDQVMALCEKERAEPLETIVVDTAGQIEIFTWSASGTIITELLASSFPTVVLYVIDTPRCLAPQTFMSNMMQACSILYKTQLPMILVYNKVDVTRHDLPLKWMKDFDAFQRALDSDDTYAASLAKSLSLVLDEFYENLTAAIRRGAVEYEEFYKADLEKRKAAKRAAEADRAAEELRKLEVDIAEGRHGAQEVMVSSVDGVISREQGLDK